MFSESLTGDNRVNTGSKQGERRFESSRNRRTDEVLNFYQQVLTLLGGGGEGGARSRRVEERCWMMMWCLKSLLRCRADTDIRVNEMMDF